MGEITLAKNTYPVGLRQSVIAGGLPNEPLHVEGIDVGDIVLACVSVDLDPVNTQEPIDSLKDVKIIGKDTITLVDSNTTGWCLILTFFDVM